MAYNHGREDRKWRIWKEAEEKLLRECGVDEATIEQIRTKIKKNPILKIINFFVTTVSFVSGIMAIVMGWNAFWTLIKSFIK